MFFGKFFHSRCTVPGKAKRKRLARPAGVNHVFSTAYPFKRIQTLQSL